MQEKPDPSDRWITKREAMQIGGVSLSTIDRWIAEDKFETNTKAGRRIWLPSFRAFLKSRD